MGIPRFGPHQADRGTFPVASFLSVDWALPALLYDQTVTQTECPSRWKPQSVRQYFLLSINLERTRWTCTPCLNSPAAMNPRSESLFWMACKTWCREVCCVKMARISTAALKAGGSWLPARARLRCTHARDATCAMKRQRELFRCSPNFS